jgi:DNA repair exonuclease SbcCD ATPase subunit
MCTRRLGALAVAVLLGLAGCKGNKDADATTAAAAAPDPAAQKEQQDLLARRDALLKSRQQIKDEQAKIEQQRQTIAQQGGDTSELDKQAADLKNKDDQLAGEQDQLVDAIASKLAQNDAMRTAGNDKAAQVAAREAGMAAREKAVAAREDRVAQREAQLASREQQEAVREKETCSAAATPTTIIQTVDAKGSKYTKKDVEPLLKRARDDMGRKGVLAGDLPAQAQGLEREATKAMGDGDYGAAYFAARQLQATVDATKIDRAFISAKIGRLSARMKGTTLDGGKQKQVDDLFSDATAKYGDGDFAGANRKLNQIYAIVQ